MVNTSHQTVRIQAQLSPNAHKILTPEALRFLVKLHREFNSKRLHLLKQRKERQAALDQGERPQFLTQTASIRTDPSWHVAPCPPDLQRRWVEITGPTDRKMFINALNSGANVFMADFEDANSPTWDNMVEGQFNVMEAVAHTLKHTSPEGKHYQLNPKVAVLMVRPRGWHLAEKHLLIDDAPISASLFDFGLAFFHNATRLIQKESGPYFYLPKLENHLEARLWNDVFLCAQEQINIPRGSIRATVLLETILAAFEMEEILYELREHCSGLNAGRWDYIFSAIKKFGRRKEALMPDRSEITMTVPFMRAYTELLVKTCHKRGAHALGGMSAFVPSRKDPLINEKALKQVREDKIRETRDGFDGTWVAHPDLVPIAHQIFEGHMRLRPHQKENKREEVGPKADDLLDFHIPHATITEEGVRKNIAVALHYLHAWLSGTGAVAIFNLMEDVATAEISRAQLWQWIIQGKITSEHYEALAAAEVKSSLPEQNLTQAKKLLDHLVLSEPFIQFLTEPAYELLLSAEGHP